METIYAPSIEESDFVQPSVGLHCPYNETGHQIQVVAGAVAHPNLPHSSLACVRMCFSRLDKGKDSENSSVHPFDSPLCQVTGVNLNLLHHLNPIIQCLARTSEKLSSDYGKDYLSAVIHCVTCSS